LESISHIERTNAVEHLLHAKSEACITDEGAESAEYTITGKMSLTDYKEILVIFRGGQPWFHDPFEERQMKALFLSIDYDSASGSFEFVLVEDAEQDEIKS